MENSQEKKSLICIDESSKGFLLLTSRKAAAELVGTYVAMFVGCGSAIIAHEKSITLVGAALASGLSVMAVVYSLGHISGSHVNPAATISLAVVGKFSWKSVPAYVLAQLVGSILGNLTLRLLFNGEQTAATLTLPGGPNPANDIKVVVWEIVLTFILMLIVCGAAVDPRAPKGIGGACIGMTVCFDIIIAGTTSGASMNPARSFGPAVANLNFNKLWIYMISPVIGAIAGSSLYYFLQFSNGDLKAESSRKTAVIPVDTNLDLDDRVLSDKSTEFP